jgi:RNA polymerase sigma factor (sigma-70 family)
MTDAGTPSWVSERVLHAAQSGDDRAIATLLDSSHLHVRRFARSLCATPEDAEEAAQEALIVLYRKVGTLRAAAALASWMFQIVRNECIRRSRVALRRPVQTMAAESSAEEAALAHMEMERIVASIAALPADQRAVLVLRDIQGLSGAATAKTLGLSKAAMKSRLHRGREALRASLGARPDGAPRSPDNGEVGNEIAGEGSAAGVGAGWDRMSETSRDAGGRREQGCRPSAGGKQMY